MTADPRLMLFLQETEARLKAFDEGVERTCAATRTSSVARAILADWRKLRPGLYITLGAAYGGALKRDPLLKLDLDDPPANVSWGDKREKSE